MSESTAPTRTSPTRSQRLTKRALWLVLHVALPALVLLGAGYAVYGLMQTPPKPERREPTKRAPLVEVAAAQLADEPVSVYASGLVLSAQRVELRPQVAGKIQWLAEDLEPGAQFKAGSPLFRIEKSDYELAQLQRQSELDAASARVNAAKQGLFSAERDLAIELANAEVAKREYELFGGELSESERALVLREPQVAAARAAIESAKANIATAEADLEQAKANLAVADLDMKRTEVAAPFDAVVVERLADLGDTVSAQTSLVTLVGTAKYWVELAVPESELKWIRMPTGDRAGSPVHFGNGAAWGVGGERIGRVIRIMPTVDAAGRMARVLCEIEDPLSLRPREAGSGNVEPTVLVGSYLSARIEGIQTPQAVVIPRAWVREGDQVWVLTDGGELSVREIESVYRGPDHLLVSSGVEPGERVVTTDLATPVDGMELRLAPRDQPGNPKPVGHEANRDHTPSSTTN